MATDGPGPTDAGPPAPVLAIPSAALSTDGLLQIYGQLVDTTGRPAAGVGLELNSANNTTLAVTATDGNGAFVLRVSTALVQSAAALSKDFWMLINGNTKALPVIGLIELQPGVHGPVQLVVAKAPPEGTRVAPAPMLIGDENDLLNAFKLLPNLFTKPQSAEPISGCSPYAGPSAATRVVYFNQLVMFATAASNGSPDQPIEAIDITFAPPVANTAAPRYGAVLDFRQDWWEAGYGLGDLLYSVPLAPCEETKIATVDWRRRDWATKQTALSESAFQDTLISRDDAISEATRMIADKSVHSSDMGGGGSISIPFVTASGAAQVSDMKSLTTATADASRSISDRVRQVSNTLRNTRSFAVVETTQAEQSTVQTRVLSNHNHCHTVTFQYYQVLRHYLLATQLRATPRPAVFLPFKPITFTVDLVSQCAYLLRRALLDPTLQPVLDSVMGIPDPIGAVSQSSNQSVSPFASGTQGTVLMRAFTTLNGSNAGLADRFDTLDKRTPIVELKDLVLLVNEQPQYLGSPTPDNWPNPGPTWGLRQPTDGFSFGQPIDLSTTVRLGIRNTSSTTNYVLDDFILSANIGGNVQQLFWSPTVELNAGRSFVIELARRPDVGIGMLRLLKHLNANALYYTSALISAGDSALRYTILASRFDAAGNPYSDLVDNSVEGFIGNYVAFALKQPSYLPGKYQTETGFDLGASRNERLITLPSPGIFAESQLGQCQACEVIDSTRFWDWTKSPCPDHAPDITAAMLASRNQDLTKALDVATSTLVPPGVQIPTEPEPMIKIGDATLANLTKDLQITNQADLLKLVQGLAQASSDNYKSTLAASAQSKGSLQPGQGGLSAAGSGALDASGGGGVAATAGAGDLVPSAVVALV